ncbi:hypothetical protein [Ligilactobacillus ceti]|uniref:hypothetical protein n=1 Tax=Ligilactobacillus ceti TaxID=395085 RepID=UPI0004831B0D|nr:hypothetical protein [Ligilactobacillus ceti]
MKHKLKISLSKKPKNEGLASYRALTFKEKLLYFFLGKDKDVMVFVPGDKISEVSISREGE